MPIGPNQIANYIDEKHVKSIVENIDARLTEAAWVRDNKCGDGDKTHFMFVGAGEVTLGEKAYLIKAYQDAGWSRVEVRNSSENGEQGGLWSVTLYQFPK